MCLLNDKQLAIIAKDVENEGINYSHLSVDLIDHICCDIELRMDQGISFELAYEQVKKEFDIKGLRRIQQDTLMLIDKNYRIMKSSMKLTGALALALMAFGALFKIMHWPMAGVMLFISFSFTTLVFFPTLLYVMYKEVNQKKQAGLYIIAFVSGTAFMTSVLFKIMHWPTANLLFFSGLGIMAYVLIPMIIFTKIKQLKINKSVFLIGLISIMIFLTGMILKIMHWPGASILLTFGSALLVIGFIPLFYMVEVRKSEKPRIDFLFGIIALTYFILFSFLMSFRGNQHALIDFNYQDNSFRQSTGFLAEKNSEIIDSLSMKQVALFSDKANEVCNMAEEIKITILQKSFGIDRGDAMILNKSNTPVLTVNKTTDYLLPEHHSDSPLLKLKKEIDEFNKLYNSLTADSSKMVLIQNKLLSTEKRPFKNTNQLLNWEHNYFEYKPPAAVLNMLSLLQYNIRLAENKALLELVSNVKNN